MEPDRCTRCGADRPDPPTRVCARCLARAALGVVDELAGELGLASAEGAVMLGRYPILGELGEGGMGRVLRLLDPDVGREIAGKVLQRDDDAWLRASFLREAQVLGQLEHPGIVPLHELAQTPAGELYFTMKRVEGEDLDALLRRIRETVDPGDGRRPPPRLLELLQIFGKICDAVAFAHSRGVIHRDLKPANVMLGRFGEVQVMDWGIARTVGADLAAAPGAERYATGAADVTQAGDVIGTPAYMPPEQARGEVDRIDQRADVYALGAILYEMLSGEPPYDGDSSGEVLAQVVAGPPPSVDRRAPDRAIPRELAAVVGKAMGRRRGERYASVEQLHDDVEAWLAGRTLSAADYTAWQLVRRWVARHRLGVAVAAAGLVAGLGFGSYYVWSQRQQARLSRRYLRERDAARSARRTAEQEKTRALRAIRERDRYIALKPGLARAMTRRAEEHLGAGRLEVALREFGAAIEADPRYATAYAGRARALLRLGERRAALEDYDRVLRYGGPSRGALEERGKLRVALGRYREAQADFGAVIEGWPRHSWGYYYRGMSRLIVGDPVGAKADLQAAARENVNDLWSRVWLFALDGDSGRLGRLARQETFPAALAQHCLGQMTADALMARIALTKPESLRQVQCVRAQALLAAIAGREGRSEDHLARCRAVVASGRTSMFEVHWARARLAAR